MGFLEEAGGGLFHRDDLWEEDLDGHALPQLFVRRLHHRAHAARSDDPLHAVFPADQIADLNRGLGLRLAGSHGLAVGQSIASAFQMPCPPTTGRRVRHLGD